MYTTTWKDIFIKGINVYLACLFFQLNHPGTWGDEENKPHAFVINANDWNWVYYHALQIVDTKTLIFSIIQEGFYAELATASLVQHFFVLFSFSCTPNLLFQRKKRVHSLQEIQQCTTEPSSSEGLNVVIAFKLSHAMLITSQ